MNTNRILIALMLISALLLTSCASRARVGELRTESKSVELGEVESVHTKIEFGAGNLEVSGGADELLQADFTYNVVRLKPEVKFTNGTLTIRQPEIKGLPALQGISDFRNEWSLRLNNDVPMDLSIDVGAGTSDLHLADLSLTGLHISLGASDSTIDLRGNWTDNLDVTIDSGATDITVLLPKDIGVRVDVDAGPTAVKAEGLTKDGNIYTNAAYDVSDVTLRIKMEIGIGLINLEVAEDQTQEDPGSAMISGWVWHDQCDSGKDGQPTPATTPLGCVKEVSPLGSYHADGGLATDEPLIEGVVVTLGEGECPSTGLSETSTIITDLSYSFSSLKAGTYCVSIDPQREPNYSILRPGVWTYPLVSQGVISTTVTVTAGEYKGMVNFGWDYQFLPSVSQACTDSAKFVSDVNMPDNTVVASNTAFTKTWRLKNTGTCSWDSNYLVAYLSGDTMSQQPGYFIVPQGQMVAPDQTVDISVGMTAPPENGSYASYWGLKKVDGGFMPIQGGANGNSFYVKIRVNDGIAAGKITVESISIELEQGSGAVCSANSTYFVQASITADGATTAMYEIGSTAGQIPAGYFQDANNNLSSYITGSVTFDQVGTRTINLRFVGPYPYPNDITVNLRVNGGVWHNTKLACQ